MASEYTNDQSMDTAIDNETIDDGLTEVESNYGDDMMLQVGDINQESGEESKWAAS